MTSWNFRLFWNSRRKLKMKMWTELLNSFSPTLPRFLSYHITKKKLSMLGFHWFWWTFPLLDISIFAKFWKSCNSHPQENQGEMLRHLAQIASGPTEGKAFLNDILTNAFSNTLASSLEYLYQVEKANQGLSRWQIVSLRVWCWRSRKTTTQKPWAGFCRWDKMRAWVVKSKIQVEIQS